MSCRIGPELVGDESPRWFALVFQGVAEEALSGSMISPFGDQDIDYVPILIHRPPQVATLALDGYEYFIDVPDVTQTTLLPAQGSSVRSAELETPVSNGFVGDSDTTFSEQVFDIAETERESMVEPDGVADDFRGKPVTSIQ